MPVKIPQAIREAMIVRGLEQYQLAVQAADDQKPDRYWCEVVVNAAIDEFELRMNAATAKPAEPEIGLGNKIGSIDERGPTALGGPPEVLKKEAIARGFSGEACPHCLNFRMRRTGTCLTCQDCGFNKGCD